MKLHIYVTGGPARIPDAKLVWDAFERAVALPFKYDKPAIFNVSDHTDVSEIAEACVADGVAMIRVTPLLLDSQRPNLTLLHESLHLASFIGPLQDMYEAVTKIKQTYPDEYPGAAIGHALGRHLFEVDAEFALKDQFQNYATDRAAAYVHDVETTLGTLSRDLPADDPQRPYCALYDQLRAELAGLLARDDGVEIKLSASLEKTPEWCADEIEKLHGMLSPKFNDYADLPRWGAKTYEAVVGLIIERVQRTNGFEGTRH